MRQLDGLVNQIATASDEQSAGISQINTAVSEMDKTTQSDAASAEESASASQELNAQAESLREAVAGLQQLVGGDSLAQRSAASSAVPRPVKSVAGNVENDGSNSHHRMPASTSNREEALAMPDDADFRNF